MISTEHDHDIFEQKQSRTSYNTQTGTAHIPIEQLNSNQNQKRQRSGGKKEGKPNRWIEPSRENLEQETLRIQTSSDGTITKRECLDAMEAWVYHAINDKEIKFAKRAETLLKIVGDRLNIIPRLDYYESIIRAYTSSCSDNDDTTTHAFESAKRADDVLQHVIRYTPHTPTAEAFKGVISAWADTGSYDAGLRTAAVRKSMVSHIGDQSDAKSIRAEMKAWTGSDHPEAPERILQSLLMYIQHWANAQDDSERVNAITPPTESMFHAAMGALSKSATQYRQRPMRQVAKQLDDIAKLMRDRQEEWKITPSLRTFMIVLGAWERVEKVEQKGEAAQRAEVLLEYMIKTAMNNEKEHQLRNGKAAKDNRIMPTNTSFTSVMVAWCHAKQPDRAELLYKRLVKLYKTTMDAKLLPTTYVANAMLSGYAKLGKPDRIMEVMSTMQRVALDTKHPACQLDLRTFNILMNALCKAQQASDCLIVLDWLEYHNEKRTTKSQLGNPDKYSSFFNPVTIKGLEPPNHITYSCVLEALGKSGMVRNAESILGRMKERGIQPSQISYTSVIHGYSLMSHDPNNVARAHKVFQEVSAHERPDVICCTAFINVCSSAQPMERDLALDLALQVFYEHDRNEKTYNAMALAIQRLVVWHESDQLNQGARWSTTAEAAEVQTSMMQKLIRECCQAGYLSRSALISMEQVVGKNQTAVIMGEDRLRRAWSSKVDPFNQP